MLKHWSIVMMAASVLGVPAALITAHEPERVITAHETERGSASSTAVSAQSTRTPDAEKGQQPPTPPHLHPDLRPPARDRKRRHRRPRRRPHRRSRANLSTSRWTP